MKAENRKGHRHRDNAEREEREGAHSTVSREGTKRERDGASDLLERILDRDNPTRLPLNAWGKSPGLITR